MKILYLTREFPPFMVGGIAKHTLQLTKAMKKLGIEFKVLSFGDSTFSTDEIKFLDPQSSIISKTESQIKEDVRIPFDIIRFTKAANKLVRNEDFDILHVEEPYVGACVFHPKKVTTIHDTSYGEIRPLLHKLTDFSSLKRIAFYASLGFSCEQMSAFSSKSLIVPFSHVKKELTQVYGISGEKISVIPNGIELPPASLLLQKRLAKEKLGLSSDRILIFTAARHVYRKRLETLVEAAKLLKIDQDSNFLVLIAGEGPCRRGIEELIRNSKLTDVVRTTGWLPKDRLALCYNASDIFVLTSEYETGPISLLEAMSYGDSVVSSRIDGFPLLMKNREEGLLFNVGDSLTLSAHLKSLLNDEGLRNRLAVFGRRFAERFDWGNIAKQTLDVYRSL